MGRAPQRVTFGVVLAVPEYRAVWAAELFSVAGDQLARVALAVLVFARTNSASWAAGTYALTFAPAFLGGIFLGRLGDQYPRRTVMVTSDLVRALLVALVAVPGMPLGALCVLVAGVTLAGGPFKAAQQALLTQVFSSDRTRFTVGQALRQVTQQSAQVAAFVGGGVLAAAISPVACLLVDAGSFLVSAAIVWRGVVPRPAAAPGSSLSSVAAFVAVARLVWRDPPLRISFALRCLLGLYIAPEALAAPYAASLGAGAGAVGWLLASDPAGSVIGGYVWGRWVPESLRDRAVGVVAVLAGLPLVLCLFRPGLPVSMLVFAATGMAATACLIQTNTVVTLHVADKHRGHVSGWLSAVLLTAQGLGALAAGVLADWIGPFATVATAGAAGMVATIPVARAWRRC